MLNDAATDREEDAIQKRMTEYASTLRYDMLPDDVIAGAKLRIIDTFGALVAGFDGEVSRIARNTAAIMRVADGVSVVGTTAHTKTSRWSTAHVSSSS